MSQSLQTRPFHILVPVAVGVQNAPRDDEYFSPKMDLNPFDGVFVGVADRYFGILNRVRQPTVVDPWLPDP